MTKFTHKGWLGFCPVYLDMRGDGPEVEPRSFIFAPLLWLSLGIYNCCATVLSAIDPSFDPQWPIRITGSLEQ